MREDPGSVDPETLIRINQQLVKNDLKQIENYARRQSWNFTLTSSGMIYEILSEGQGIPVASGDEVSFLYACSLLDGTLLYSSDSLGAKRFVVDYQEVEAGLNDLSKLLHEGDSVRLLLPPHLAFGLAGDGKRVPARASLLYHLRLLSVQAKE